MLTTRTGTRRNIVASQRLAVGAAMTLTVLLAGCASTQTSTPQSTPSVAASTPARGVDAATETRSLGDVEPVTVDGQKQLVTDERGTYQKVQLAADSPLGLTVNTNILNPDVETQGFSEEDVLAAQQFLSRFIASEVLDSTALDRDLDGYRDWVTATGQNYWQQQWREGIVAETSPALVNNGVGAEIAIRYVRDGKPRLSHATISYSSITAATADYGTFLRFDGKYEADYRAKNADVIAAYEAAGYSQDDTLSTLPKLGDENAESIVKGTMTFTFGVIKVGDQWELSGYQNNFDNTIQK